jgi:5-methylthioadenosine/S-adenosylhomocysteine deaminase
MPPTAIPKAAFPMRSRPWSTPSARRLQAKTKGVKRVICDGEIIYEEGRFTRVDQAASLRALHEDLQRALTDDEIERRGLSRALLPHVRAFYANYFDAAAHQPFYLTSSKV